MKANELENLIRESVKETLSQKPTKRKRGKKTLKEGAEFSGGSFGADIALEPKVERAVMLAAHCAKVITGGIARSPDASGSALEKCFDDILGLFLDPQGEFSVPDLNPDELRHEFATQLSHQMTNPGSKIAKATRLILDKVVDKLNVYVGEAMITEAGKEIPTDPGWFDTQTDTEMHSREPRRDHPTSRHMIDLLKKMILVYQKRQNRKINKYDLNWIVQHVSDHDHYSQPLPDDVVWDLAHVAVEELQDKGLFESFSSRPRKKKGR